MKLEECFEVARDFKALYSKLGFTEGGETYIHANINGQAVGGPCSNMDEYKDFVMKIENEEVRNVLLNDYNKIDFRWDRCAPNFEPVEINADAYLEISNLKQVHLHLQIYVNL